MLRLRLQIQRNELPTVNTLWPVSDTQLRQTIVQLLEQVNSVFPLESDTWGLEHYTVSIGHYECLHYHEIGSVCKDEDEVVIRPLRYAEVRARTLLGRDQIAADGRHLHDGVPWGRPLLRKPVRPLVRIPPRKKQRVKEVGKGREVGNEDFARAIVRKMERNLARLENSESRCEDVRELEYEEEDDDDFLPDEGDAEMDSDNAPHEDSSSESEDSSSASEAEKTSSDSNAGSSSEASSESLDGSDDKSEASFEGFRPDECEVSPAQAAPQIVRDTKELEAESSGGIPFQGKNATRIRNARRRDQKTLKYLVGAGVLSKGSGLKDLHELQASGYDVRATADSRKSPFDDTERVTDGSEDIGVQHASTRGQVCVATEATRQDHSEIDLEAKRQGLIDAIASGGIDVTESMASKAPKRKAAEALGDNDGPPDEYSTKQSSSLLTDVESSEFTGKLSGQDLPRPGDNRQTRMIFGALGVRAPTTDSEKDFLQKKLARRAGRNMSGIEQMPANQRKDAAPNDLPEQPREEDEDLDSWREKIELSAVECVGEPLTYPEPPFPFRKHWHNKKKRNGSAYMAPNKRRKKGSGDTSATQHIFTESYDKYNTDGSGDALNYDDIDDDDQGFEAEDEYCDWDDSAFLEDTYIEDNTADPASQQLLNETSSAQAELSDGFPPLPLDLAALPPFAEGNAQVGDYIVYDELACSAATNWQPKTLTLTAQLQTKQDDGWEVLLAQRDMPSKIYDETGKRVYAKFEMEDVSEDEDGLEGGDRIRYVQWSQMAAAKLLLRPEGNDNTVPEQ